MPHSFTKKDIDTLSKQVLEEKRCILETLYREHIELDPSMLYDNFCKDQQHLKVRGESQANVDDDEQWISLDDFEEVYRKLDEIDKKCNELPATANANVVANVCARKEMKPLKRFNSTSDIDKTLSLSVTNVNGAPTKVFAVPLAPPPPPPPTQLQTTKSELSRSSEDMHASHKLTTDQLADFNALKRVILAQLDEMDKDENSDALDLNEIQKKFLASFERLQGFFSEIEKLEGIKPKEDDVVCDPLKNLDHELCALLNKLSEALEYVRFLIDNQNMYRSVNDIKPLDALLSDNVTEILERYYYANQ